MIQVPLTQGQVALIDDCDAWVLDFKWCAVWKDSTQSYYARRTKYLDGKQYNIYMSREIMGNPKGMVVDHINHDTLDNRRQNLEIKSNADNMHNGKLKKTNTSGYRGVTWHKYANKWQVQYLHASYGVSNRGNNSVKKHLGLFDDPIEAAHAYDKEKFRLTGSTLGLNFPEDYT